LKLSILVEVEEIAFSGSRLAVLDFDAGRTLGRVLRQVGDDRDDGGNQDERHRDLQERTHGESPHYRFFFYADPSSGVRASSSFRSASPAPLRGPAATGTRRSECRCFRAASCTSSAVTAATSRRNFSR